MFELISAHASIVAVSQIVRSRKIRLYDGLYSALDWYALSHMLAASLLGERQWSLYSYNLVWTLRT